MTDLVRKDKPLITVITVVRNGASELEQTILSVIQQSYEKLEYIIIDGCSTDGTVNVIKKYQSELKLWLSEQDNGIYDAMNKGWSLARDDSFILFLGAGDRLISLPDNMEEFGANEIVYGKVILGDAAVFNSCADIWLRIYNTLHHQALLINKAVYPQPPFNCNYKVYADFDFNQRLCKKGAKFVYSNAFQSVAAPPGVSGKFLLAEAMAIVRKNFGNFWSLLTLIGFLAVKVIPVMKRFRPISESPSRNSIR